MRILSATADAEEWDSLIAKLPAELQDVHFTSAYARVQEHAGGKGILAVETSSYGGFIAQPFLMQSIEGTGLFDLKSLYGFGGPFTDNATPYSAEALGMVWHDELTAWARKNGIVSEYCCLHPLLAHHQLPLVRTENIVFSKEVVVIENLKTFSDSKVSRRIRRAIKDTREQSLVIEAAQPLTFTQLYNASMNRLDAAAHWRFDLDYWEAHLHEGVGARFLFLLDVSVPRRCLLVIGRGETAYAHFLGSDGEGNFDPILYYDAARYLARNGYSRFHLGGGLTSREDDPLLFFKSGFSDKRYKVGTYRRVFQPGIYDTLVKQFAKPADTSWFPAYRAAV